MIEPTNQTTVDDLNKLQTNGIDNAIEAAKKSGDVIVKTSIEPTNVETPKPEEVTVIPKDLTVVGKKEIKGDENAPFILSAEDPLAKGYLVYEEATDIIVPNVFYANRSTDTVIEYVIGEDDKLMVFKESNGTENIALMLRKKKVYFKKV